MKKVKGNTLCVLQTKTSSKNSIGECVNLWNDTISFMGVLGLQSGDSKYSNYNAKIEESTHTIVCDFISEIYELKDKDTRVIAKDRIYDVLLIDNPDEFDEHLEIYLRFAGGQNVS